MGRRRLLLIRHPAAPGADGLCYGRCELPAGDGRATVAAAIARLGGAPASVWTSPSVRCRAVAEAIATAVGTVPRVDARLHELDFGEWEGRLWRDLPRAEVDRWIADPMEGAPPGGETGAALIARVRAFLAEVQRGEEALSRKGRAGFPVIVVVSHGGPLKILAALTAGREIDLWEPPPACGSVTEPARPPAD